MLMKFTRTSTIFKSITFPWFSKIANPDLLLLRSSYSFCVKQDQESDYVDHEEQLGKARGPAKIFKPRTQNREKSTEKQSRDKVFKHKNEKDRDSELSVIFRQYRQDVQKEGVNTHRLAACCKLVSNQYRTDRHHQFLGQREQIQKLMEALSRLDFRKASFQDLMNMLDFVRTAGRIESLNRRSLEFGRTALLNAVGDYCSALDTIATPQLIFLYCKLCPLPYAQLNALTVHVHDRMVDMANEGGLPFSNYQFYVLFKSLSKKKFLSYPDKRILEMLLVGLQGRVNEMDSQMITSMVKAFIDLRAQNAISDNRMLKVIESVLELGVKTVQNGISSKQSQYLLECRPNDNPYYKKIISIIHTRLLHKLRNKTVNFNPLKTILACYLHLRKTDSEQRQLVIQISTELFQKQVRDRRFLQSNLIELLREGFFGSEVPNLNGLVSRADFDFFWSVPCYYSIHGQVFPIEPLLIKLRTVLKRFDQDVNFLKAAISASIQARLQPENTQLHEMAKGIQELIRSASWEEIGVEWLIRIGIYNPQVIRAFVRQFGSLFESRVRPSPQDLRRQFGLSRGERLEYLPFWEYLFSVGEFDRDCPQEIVVRSPLSACTLVAIKETGKMNCPLDGKTLLLAGLLGKVWSGRLKVGESETNITIELLREYIQVLRLGRDSFEQIYWNLVRSLVRDYKEVRRNNLPSLNFLLMGLLTSGSRRTRNGIHFKNFLVDLLSNPSILSFDNQSSHFKGAILRTALQHNMLLEHHLSVIDINYFSSEEVALLKAMAGQYQCQKVDSHNFLPFLRSSLPPPQRLSEFSLFLDKFGGEFSLEQLQKCLLFFSLERDSATDLILLRLVKKLINKLVVRQVDVLGIIANIRGHLSIADRKVFADLLMEVFKQLEANMHDWALFDHLQLLKYLNMYAIPHQTYRTALMDYAFRYQFRGTGLVEIMWEICKRGETKLSAQQFVQLGNYSTFSPEAYMKLVLIHENLLVEAGSLLEQMSRYQVKPVADSLFAKYANTRFGLTLKRTQGEGAVFRGASELGQSLLERLQREGVPVKRDELGSDRIFLLGERVLLIFGNFGQAGQTQLFQRILNYFYPQREIVVVGSNASIRQLHDLLLHLRGVQLDEREVGQIAQDLHMI